MKIHHFSEIDSVISDTLSRLRDVNLQQDRGRFREYLNRLGLWIGYDVSETMDFEDVEVRTPLGVHHSRRFKSQPVLATILRAGLPLLQGLADVFPDADCAYISAFRQYQTEKEFTIVTGYVACPPLTGKRLILADPMLATGSSMLKVYHSLVAEKGIPAYTDFISVLGSKSGVENLQDGAPENSTLWIGAIDPELNDHGYIVPGLGDAGDLAFGEK